MTRAACRAAFLVASTLALASCGLGPGDELGGAGAELRVTRDFGQELLASTERAEVRESDTVMRFLESERDVETAYGGGFVQAIDGLAGDGADGRRDWFYFVNGVEADVGAAEFTLSPGDVVQWDYRYWDAAMSVPAIVGAFPEPFLHGFRGERVPTRVECEDDDSAACEEVKDRLGEAGVTATGARLATSAGEQILRVVVGTWPAVRQVKALQFIERGPNESGVFARLPEDGSELILLDEDGREVRTLGPGSGLLAATQLPPQQPVWVVTGVDEAGVEAAAEALNEDVLRDRFAVAVTPDGPTPLPMTEASVPDDVASSVTGAGGVSTVPGSTAGAGGGR